MRKVIGGPLNLAGGADEDVEAFERESWPTIFACGDNILLSVHAIPDNLRSYTRQAISPLCGHHRL